MKEYIITEYYTNKFYTIKNSIKDAYNLCKRLNLNSNFKIMEYDEENDEYTHVNVSEFMFEYEENKIKDFSVFQTW